jgi:tripartite-type tricarboxylate transporter receptor subunit TctC
MNTALRAGALLVGLLGFAPVVSAQDYPSKPIRILVGFAAGGGTDVTTRVLAPRLAERIGQPVIVENRPGAAGNIATELAVRAAPDGYTLLMGTIAALAVNPTLYGSLPFDPQKDLTPISLAVSLPNVIAVHPSVPAQSLTELVALAKAKPGSLNYSTSGSGSAGHLAGELFKTLVGVDLTHVPYKGGAPAMTDLVGGVVQMGFATATGAIPMIKAGKIRALAVTTASRSVTLPDVPTVEEAIGVKGYESNNWYGLVGPKGLPRAVVDKWHAVMVATLNEPEIKEKLLMQGLEVSPSPTPDAFAAYIKRETEVWSKVVKATGAKAE